MENSALMHYGVLGMKWGVRKDGMPQGYQGSGRGRGNNGGRALATVGKKSDSSDYLKTEDTPQEAAALAVNREGKYYQHGRSQNCMMCTTAYDLRRRGMDVEAGKTSAGFDAKAVLEWYDNVKISDVKATLPGNDPENYEWDDGLNLYYKDPKAYEQARVTLKDNTMRKLKAQGEGARGNLMVSWDSGGGHSVAYEVHDGEVHLYDGQRGKEISADKLFYAVTPCANVKYARLDKATPKMEFLKENGIVQDRGSKTKVKKIDKAERKAIVKDLKTAAKMSTHKQQVEAVDKILDKYGPTKVSRAASDQIDIDNAKFVAFFLLSNVALPAALMIPYLLSS